MTEQHPQIPAAVLSRLEAFARKYLKIGIPWLADLYAKVKAFPEVEELGEMLRRNVPRNKVTGTGRFEELSSPEQLQLLYTFCTYAPASMIENIVRALESKVLSAGQRMDMDKKRFKSKDKTQNALSVKRLGEYLDLYEVRIFKLHGDFIPSPFQRRMDILYELLKAACEAHAIIEWCFGSPEISDELQRYRQKTEGMSSQSLQKFERSYNKFVNTLAMVRAYQDVQHGMEVLLSLDGEYILHTSPHTKRVMSVTTSVDRVPAQVQWQSWSNWPLIKLRGAKMSDSNIDALAAELQNAVEVSKSDKKGKKRKVSPPARERKNVVSDARSVGNYPKRAKLFMPSQTELADEILDQANTNNSWIEVKSRRRATSNNSNKTADNKQRCRNILKSRYAPAMFDSHVRDGFVKTLIRKRGSVILMLPEQNGESKLHGTISLPNSNRKGFHITRGLKHSKRYYYTGAGRLQGALLYDSIVGGLTWHEGSDVSVPADVTSLSRNMAKYVGKYLK